jgi:hypothetical protein
MANFIKLQASVCCTEEAVQFVVDDPTSAITTGNTYYFTVGENRYCATVNVTGIGEGPATASFTGDYTSCEECLSGITTAVQVTKCVRGESYFIDIATFTTLPTIGDVYYMTITLDDTIITSCFTIRCFVTPRDGERILSLTSISDSYTRCTECLVNNFTIYQVNTCLEPFTSYFIEFPSGFDYQSQQSSEGKDKRKKIKLIFMIDDLEKVFEKDKNNQVKVEFKNQVENQLSEQFKQKIILEDVQIIHR